MFLVTIFFIFHRKCVALKSILSQVWVLSVFVCSRKGQDIFLNFLPFNKNISSYVMRVFCLFLLMFMFLFFQSNNFHMMLFVQNDVLFFFQFLVLSLSAMLVLPSDFIIVDFFFSNRRVTTGHTFSATTVKFILFSVVKKLENLTHEALPQRVTNDPKGDAFAPS